MYVTSSIMPIPSKGKGQLFYCLETAYLAFYWKCAKVYL